ncbi:response regulator [Paenibacillus sp. 1P07SE]|uniref:response regulator n=1 Tax=Paenibacillus sp. 1P07SE TaxID=3132209 RepID=UPI0039A6C934
MKAILVDDERLALHTLEKLLKHFGHLTVAGTYQDAAEALEAVARIRPDIVFLDIGMPDMNGLELSAHIQTRSPSSAVVFVTAYDEYAIQAFELEALDYLLKPVTLERLAQTVQRLSEQRVTEGSHAAPAGQIKLHCLGSLQLELPGQERVALKWRTMKVKELFAYLLHHRGQLISKMALVDLLWPELDETNGLANLQTTISRVRKLWKEWSGQLGGEELFTIDYVSYGYRLEHANMDIDVEEWERSLRSLPPPTTANLWRHQELAEKYTGHYLGEDDYAWAEGERERLKALWISHCRRLGRFYEKQGMDNELISLYHKIQQLDPLLEESYLVLMKAYARLQHPASVHKQFEHLQSVLRHEMQASPNGEIDFWYKKWVKHG